MEVVKDYYKVLGVEQGITDENLKKVYRKLSKEYHPDNNPDNKEAEAKFKEISEAYSILSDKMKRQMLDEYLNQASETQVEEEKQTADDIQSMSREKEEEYTDILNRFSKVRNKETNSLYEELISKLANKRNRANKVEDKEKEAELPEEETKQVNVAEAKKKDDTNIKLKREYVVNQTNSISSSVENMYNEIKKEENEFSNLAERLGLTYSITKIDDTNMYLGIEQIKDNMQKINEQLEKVDNEVKIDKVSGVLQRVEDLTHDKTVKEENSAQLKEKFEKSFHDKAHELIRKSKITELEKEKRKVDSEKVSFIGKILGKEKVKQAKIENINLRMQLLMSETQSDKPSYSLEDSLSDLYAYSKCELGKDLTPDMKEFLSVVKSDSKLKGMIDSQQLRQQFDEKVKNREREAQIIPFDENRRIRHQVKALQLQNSDLNRKIHSNRARTVTSQNNLFDIVINSNSPLNRFKNTINEINRATKIRETLQPQRESYENQVS